MTEDHNLVEIMKDRFFSAVTWDTWRCDCFDQGLVLEILLPIKALMKVPIRKPLQVNAQKTAFNRLTRKFLDAPAHLYKRVCPSVRPYVRTSVTPVRKCVAGASNGQYWLLFSSSCGSNRK